MRGTTHILAGAVVTIPVLAIAPPAAHPALLAAGAVCALVPDVDHPYSLLGRWVPWPKASRRRGPYTDWGRAWFGHPIWHRGPWHSFAAGVIVAALVALGCALGHVTLASPLAFAMAALSGFWSHLALDLLNRTPQMLFWPLSRDGFGLQGGVSQHSAEGHALEYLFIAGSLVALVHFAF